MKIKNRKYIFLFAVILCSLLFNINAGAHNEDDGIQRFLGYYLLGTEPSQLEYTSPAAMSLSFNDEGKLTRFSGLYYSTTGTSKYYDYTSYEISGDTLTCYYNGSYTYYSPNEDTSPGEHQFILTKEGNLVEGEYVWYRYDRDNSSDEKHPGTLMEVKDIDFPEGKYSKNTSFLGNKDLPRKKIKEITFLDSLENEPEDSWDVSFDHDGSVKAWMDTSEGICHVYIASEGRISAPEHSQSLFRHCVNLTKIEFNGVFDTSSAVYMGYMFASCKKLKYIYGIEDFNTSGVYSFSGMFADDKGLISLDLSSFDTSHAHEMDRIFYNCSRLERLNIPNFSFQDYCDYTDIYTGTRWQGGSPQVETQTDHTMHIKYILSYNEVEFENEEMDHLIINSYNDVIDDLRLNSGTTYYNEYSYLLLDINEDQKPELFVLRKTNNGVYNGHIRPTARSNWTTLPLI